MIRKQVELLGIESTFAEQFTEKHCILKLKNRRGRQNVNSSKIIRLALKVTGNTIQTKLIFFLFSLTYCGESCLNAYCYIAGVSPATAHPLIG